MNAVRAFRFLLVGIIGTGVNTAVLYVLHGWLGMFYLLAAVFATEVAITGNFLLNHRYTFYGEGSLSIGAKFVSFQGISWIGAGMSLALLGILTSGLHLFNVYLNNVIAITVVFVFNYVTNSKITWHREPRNVMRGAIITTVLSGFALFVGGIILVAWAAVAALRRIVRCCTGH
jgi:putative flippase GtrA